MRITSVETLRVSQRFCLVRIGTDSGLVGWGEATLESRSRTVEAAVGELADILLGEDARRIELLWQRLRKGGFYRGGPVLGSAVAGIDQALWDLKGKALGVPVYELLGGPTRDRVRVYTSVHEAPIEQMVHRARELVAAGYTALKLAPAPPVRYLESPAILDALVDKWSAMREAVGRGVDLAFDLHGRFSVPAARRLLDRLQTIDPLFVEETQPPELQRELRRICASTSIPIATGERLYDRWEVSDVIGTGIAVLQPDLAHAHGISEVMRIASYAGVHGVHLAPHCATGPLAFAACLQIDLAIDNFLIQESPLAVHESGGHPWQRFIASTPFRFENGYVLPPTGPGLGVEVDEDAVRAAAAAPPDPKTENSPVLSGADGGYAEW
ncbi:galactonate dehydratase [Rathayibacter sp. KR2-224]|uniref:galactonate dehydratase n=1 Tax=Rathayibacter sp. KR2-224 TaxID=3400913 RepID=UPI003C0B259A